VKSACNATNFQNQIKEAAKQVRHVNEVLGRLHSNLLTGDWTYVRTLALPMVPASEIDKLPANQKLCDNCRKFVLDQTILRSGKEVKRAENALQI
jgi:hypothetical protein